MNGRLYQNPRIDIQTIREEFVHVPSTAKAGSRLPFPPEAGVGWCYLGVNELYNARRHTAFFTTQPLHVPVRLPVDDLEICHVLQM